MRGWGEVGVGRGEEPIDFASGLPFAEVDGVVGVIGGVEFAVLD